MDTIEQVFKQMKKADRKLILRSTPTKGSNPFVNTAGYDKIYPSTVLTFNRINTLYDRFSALYPVTDDIVLTFKNNRIRWAVKNNDICFVDITQTEPDSFTLTVVGSPLVKANGTKVHFSYIVDKTLIFNFDDMTSWLESHDPRYIIDRICNSEHLKQISTVVGNIQTELDIEIL